MAVALNQRRFIEITVALEPKEAAYRGIWEASGKHLGGIWEASGRHLGGIWVASGRHLGRILAVP